MNKRQRKKQFKKRYGYNPPRSIDAVSFTEQLSSSIKAMPDAIKRCAEDINKFVKNIKTMPEEKFQEKLGRLTLEQAIVAKYIRYSGNKGVRD